MPATTPPNGMPRIAPNVFYDDPAAALDWLAKSFGFQLRMSMPGPDGKVMHAEMDVEDSVIMLSPTTDKEQWRSPKSLDGCVTQSLYIYIDDVDAHYGIARAAGAKILAEPEEMFWGDRTYMAEDPEGHRWTFAQQVRVVSPEDMKPPA
ncbi:MAG: VOC family protein [Deltaproteobacteria bacterium]|nr:VOC family protein [Deltaproteobacteria bacterium]